MTPSSTESQGENGLAVGIAQAAEPGVLTDCASRCRSIGESANKTLQAGVTRVLFKHHGLPRLLNGAG
jgi:hypothetical protein